MTEAPAPDAPATEAPNPESPNPESPEPKLMMLAIDAGDIRFIKNSLEHLPSLRRVLDQGTLFPLESTAEVTSASVWPSFYTGKMPGEHGISHHIQWDPSSMRMRRLSGEWFHCAPFWDDLRRAGLKACTVDVPFVYPEDKPEGTDIFNWGSHDLMGRFQTSPASLAREVRKRFGRHPMGYEIPVNKSSGTMRTLHEQLVTGARRKGELLKWLAESVEWDFFLGVFGECHRGGHILWPDLEELPTELPDTALLDVYRAVDTSLGQILDGVDWASTRVVVFSLHGMRQNYSQEHFTRRVMDRINEKFQAGNSADALDTAAPHAGQHGLIRKLRESIPPGWQYAVARSVPVGVRDWVVDREVTGGIDWRETRGIALRSDVHSFVRFNLKGRENDGMLVRDSDEYRAYKDWVITSFQGLKECGTEDPVVRDVLDGDEVLSGPRRDLLPDLVVRWAHRHRAERIYSDRLGEFEAEPESGRTGEHDTRGFAIVVNGDEGIAQLPPLSHNTHFVDVVRHLMQRPGRP